jgi:pimeloyl-ACP methyl ester carboxylesterase
VPGIRKFWGRYCRDIRDARARISSGSQVVETPCGEIEYAVMGDGPAAILAVHGAGGGFDQGLDLAVPLAGRGFRVIAPSRFGYLRTPLPPDASPAAQADAYAGLLDTLNVHKAVVIGVSAGGPSAMQFALRHPARTSALVLLVPLAYPAGVERRRNGATPKRMSMPAKWLFDAALSSDFLFWAAWRLAPRVMTQAVLGTKPALVESADPEEQARVRAVGEHILPISARRAGLLNEAAIGSSLARYELERIAAPTLVVGVEDCLYGTYEGARYSAGHIPGARFVSFPTGGHLWVGHHPQVMAEVESFLEQHAHLALAS